MNNKTAVKKDAIQALSKYSDLLWELYYQAHEKYNAFNIQYLYNIAKNGSKFSGNAIHNIEEEHRMDMDTDVMRAYEQVLDMIDAVSHMKNIDIETKKLKQDVNDLLEKIDECVQKYGYDAPSEECKCMKLYPFGALFAERIIKQMDWNYKGYTSTEIKYDPENILFHGELDITPDVITFQGRSPEELKQAFKDSVDDYIQWINNK